MSTQTQEAEATEEPREVTTQENPLRKFDAPTLKAIGSSAMVDSGATAFLPTNLGEAMEIAKVMAAGNFVPEHLRGVPGDCLAIVFQATRWAMDPFAVANKSYFVNKRMAFEAQLVNAVVNSSRALQGRLEVSWKGDGPTLDCTVRGKIKGDGKVHELTQEIGTITTKNSPLWKQSPKVQLAYYTMRAWARLYVPEVLMGVYTVDEIQDITPDADGVLPPKQEIIPPRPTRESIKAEKAAAERQRKEQVANEAHSRSIARETVDPNTGEVHDAKTDNDVGSRDTDAAGNGGGKTESEDHRNNHGGEPAGNSADAPTTVGARQIDWPKFSQMILGKILKAGNTQALVAIETDYAPEIERAVEEAPEVHAKITAALAGKRRK